MSDVAHLKISYRMSCHAAISNKQNEILQLKANCGDFDWGLSGGCFEFYGHD